jgi:hypothetical protein
MGTRTTFTAENGTNGTALTQANVPLSQAPTGSGFTFSNAHVAHGSLAYRFNAASATQSTGRVAVAASSKTMSFRVPFYVASLPPSAGQVRQFFAPRSSTGNIMRFRISNTGAIQWVDSGSANAVTTSETFSANTWYELGVQFVVGSGTTDGQYTVNVYALNGTTPINSTPYTSATYNLGTAVCAFLDLGVNDTSAGAIDLYLDSVRGEDGVTTDLGSFASSVSLTPATLTISAAAVTPTPQPVTVNLTPASFTLGPVEVTPAPQPVTLAIAPAALVLAGQPVAPAPQSVTQPVTAASVTLTAVAVNPQPQPVTVALTPASLTLTGRPLTPTPGPVTVNLTPAVLTISAAAVAAGGGGAVTVTPAGLTVSAVALTPTPGQVTFTLTPASFAVAAVPVVAQPQPITLALVAAQLTLSSVPVVGQPQQVTVTLTAAVLHLTAQNLTVAGAGAVNLTPAVLQLVPAAVTPQPQPITVSLAPASLTLTAPAADPTPQPVIVELVPAVLQLTAGLFTVTPGQTTVTLTAALLTLTALAVRFGATPVVAEPNLRIVPNRAGLLIQPNRAAVQVQPNRSTVLVE